MYPQIHRDAHTYTHTSTHTCTHFSSGCFMLVLCYVVLGFGAQLYPRAQTSAFRLTLSWATDFLLCVNLDSLVLQLSRCHLHTAGTNPLC